MKTGFVLPVPGSGETHGDLVRMAPGFLSQALNHHHGVKVTVSISLASLWKPVHYGPLRVAAGSLGQWGDGADVAEC